MLTFFRNLLYLCFGLVCLLQVACGQKGDLYLPAIPAAPNVMSEGQPQSDNTPAPGASDQSEPSESESSDTETELNRKAAAEANNETMNP